MKRWAPVLRAFIAGGVVAVVGQVITLFWTVMMGGPGPLPTFAILETMGVLGAAMFVIGLHQKLEPKGGFGLILPFNGLCTAMANAFMEASREGDVRAGARASARLVCYVIGWGAVFIFLIALLSHMVQGVF